ncbi:MAG: Arc family DNA binding domain-containing protein [Bacteroidia bacterium]|nr:Arc family DNA binding domain-containing protein [Bacteroidia bacterium]
MSKKKVFTLRVNEEMYEALEKWAADEFRSLNGQIEFLLDRALRDAKRNPKKKS